MTVVRDEKKCAHPYLRFWSKKDGLDHGLDVTRLGACMKHMAVRTTSVGCECHRGSMYRLQVAERERLNVPRTLVQHLSLLLDGHFLSTWSSA